MNIPENLDEKNFKDKDILKILKMIGLNLNVSTGGNYKDIYKKNTIRKNNLGMFFLKNEDKKIVFLTGDLFLNTIKMVEKSLKYKLFH